MRRTRLVPPPRRRWQVRYAAEQLGRTLKETLDGLAEIGEHATGPRGQIEEPVFTRLAAHFGVNLPTHSAPEPDLGVIEPPHAVDARGGLTPPPPMPSRSNHPYMEPEPRPRDLLNSTWVPSKPVEPVGEHRSGGQWQRSSTAFIDHEWALRGFTDAERDVWMAGGLKDWQAKLAEQLRGAGISPDELSADLGGWTVLQRVNQGEDVVAVARLHQRRHGRAAG